MFQELNFHLGYLLHYPSPLVGEGRVRGFYCVANATIDFNRVLAPEGEILSLAENAGAIFCQRKYPKKRQPGCRLILCFSFSTGGDRRGFLPLVHRDSSLNSPFGLFPPKTAMLGAA